jgi:polyisoprenoid-binding protein YceI
MKKLLASLVALAPALALGGISNWSIDASHSTAGFAVRHLVISQVRGEFSSFSGKLALDEADAASSRVEATLDVNSISTRVADRDVHLRSADFFDAAKYPTITFRSTKVARAGKERLAITGDLTLHGVTRPVTLDAVASPEVKGMGGETRRGFSATTKISRRDFGLTWNKLVEAGPAIGDEVVITLDIEAVKEQPKAASN